MALKKKNIFYYRISKYDPNLRINGRYTQDEWTSVSDVGKCISGKVISWNEYKIVEKKYLLVIERILTQTEVKMLKVKGVENGCGYKCKYPNKAVLTSKQDILSVMRDCLRERYWCWLVAPSILNKYWCALIKSPLVMNVGYDYYLYVGCTLDISQIRHIVSDLNLYVEENMPYGSPKITLFGRVRHRFDR